MRRKRKPSLQAVYYGVRGEADLDKFQPNYFCTRVWLAVVPPEDHDGEFVPGYACVVGELYDGDPMQKDRHRIVMDEGIALDPADFTPRERLRYGLRDDVLEHPTLYTLRDATIALKDLYWPERVYLPPGNPRFYRFFQNADGLTVYDPRYGDGRYARAQPFFISRRRTCNGVLQVDHEERAHNLQLVNSLLDTNLLEIHSDCELFWERRLPTAYRAIGLLCAEMQLNDMTYQIREMTFSDGYDYREDEEQAAGDLRSAAMDEARVLSEWASGDRRAGGSGWMQ